MNRIIICILCLSLLCGCNGVAVQTQNDKINIVTTIFPLYDFARQICGDNADVKLLIKPGSEVHSYDPLPSDMAAIYNSDLFLYIGGESDKWATTLLDDNTINSRALIDDVNGQEEHHHGHDHTDEHIWTSPQNAILMLEAIFQSVTAIDAENAEVYRQKCNDYIEKINQTSKEICDVVSQYQEPFILVADRFPFAYFTKHYGIDYEAAFDGCAVSTDISLKTMSRLTQTIEQRGVTTVFVTELSSQNIAKALSNELGVKILELHSAHNVSAIDFSSGISYVDIMYRNKLALEEGLGF